MKLSSRLKEISENADALAVNNVLMMMNWEDVFLMEVQIVSSVSHPLRRCNSNQFVYNYGREKSWRNKKCAIKVFLMVIKS